VHERPADFTDAELAAALRAHWRLDAAALTYLPVGFGGFHWQVTGQAGQRWFATASSLAGDGDFADLTATMTTAAMLAERGLSFVVAPVRAVSGDLAVRARPDYAITLYPFAAGTPGRFADVLTPADQAAVAGLLAELHGIAGDPGRVPVRSPDLPGIALLEESIRERRLSWRGGPFAEPARQLLSEHAAGLTEALAGFRGLAASLASDGRPSVITHGEPHAGNLIRRDGGFLLIDWDTVGLAPPERDLWWVAREPGTASARYAELTGRAVSQPAVEFYRLRWDLDDICSFLADFRRPHERTRDTEVAFAGFAAAARTVAHVGVIRQ
jgi:spectinomycin phosphotransferase